MNCWWTGLGREPASPHTHEKNWMWMSQVCIPISLLEKRGSHPFSSKHSTFETCGETPGCFSQTSSQMAHGSLHLHMYIYIYSRTIGYMIYSIFLYTSGKLWAQEWIDLQKSLEEPALPSFRCPWHWSKWDTSQDHVLQIDNMRWDKNHAKRGVHGLCVFLFPEWYGCWLPRFCAIHNKH